jgi:branched-chain amino acid transport system permease protein
MTDVRHLGAAAAATLAAALILPAIANAYWMSVAISAAVYVLPVAGCALLYGRLGILAMFQFAILGVGAWVALRVAFAAGLPFPLILIIAGVVCSVLGTIMSLPALRLSKIHFALLTLMAAGAVEIFFTVNGFPNGGPGFLGLRSALVAPRIMSRPQIASSDPAYFRYTLVVVFLMCSLLWSQMRGRTGRAWALMRQSAAGAQSAGINVTLYTLWAVALSCFVTGVGGALFAAQVGQALAGSFVPANSVVIFAVALLGGAYSVPGFVLGGVGAQVVPAAIEKLGGSSTTALLLFGVGLLITLLAAPEGAAGQLRELRRALGSRGGRPADSRDSNAATHA